MLYVAADFVIGVAVSLIFSLVAAFRCEVIIIGYFHNNVECFS
jgi:hypothetical protein